MSFFTNGERKGKTGSVWGLAPVGRRRIQGKGEEGEYGRNIIYSYLKVEK
jgi:hypothetical protein